MDCIVHGVAKSWTRLSNFHFNRLRFLCSEKKGIFTNVNLPCLIFHSAINLLIHSGELQVG